MVVAVGRIPKIALWDPRGEINITLCKQMLENETCWKMPWILSPFDSSPDTCCIALNKNLHKFVCDIYNNFKSVLTSVSDFLG